MPKNKTRDVEFYRCWTGREGDSGHWDTDFMPVPISVITEGEEAVDRYIRQEAPKLDWRDGEVPLFFGLYSMGSAEDNEDQDTDQ